MRRTARWPRLPLPQTASDVLTASRRFLGCWPHHGVTFQFSTLLLMMYSLRRRCWFYRRLTQVYVQLHAKLDSGGSLKRALIDSGHELMDAQAFWLTIRLASVVALLLSVLGLPIAYWIAYSRWRWKFMVEAVVALPIVLPPTVLGFYVLIA